MKHTPTPWALNKRGESLLGANGAVVTVTGLQLAIPMQPTEEASAERLSIGRLLDKVFNPKK